MTEETPTASVSDVVARIFAEYQPEPFKLRRQPQSLKKENDKEEKQPAKRPKKEALPLDLVTSDMIRHVANFLDPFELMAWSRTCKASSAACSLAFKLDCVFKEFHILKRYADRIHAKGHSWKDVLQVLLEALKELHKVYGPYQVHPLHAAMIGEALMLNLCLFENLTEDIHCRYDFGYFFDLEYHVWNLMEICASPRRYSGPNFCEDLVCGRTNDYFDDKEGLLNFRKAASARPEMIPPGPGRVLAQEGRMPYINVLCNGGETEQFGFSFQQVEGDTSPYVVFCMDYQCMPNQEASFEEWYNGPKPGSRATVDQGTKPAYEGRVKSIEQAFCQYLIDPIHYRHRDGWAPWDDWTQLLRVSWLYAHNIAPFDGRSKKGKGLWASVVQAMPEADADGDYHEWLGKENVPSFSEEYGPADEYLGPEWTLEGQEEVLYFEPHEEYGYEKFAKCFAPKYIKLNHTMAKGSDYC